MIIALWLISFRGAGWKTQIAPEMKKIDLCIIWLIVLAWLSTCWTINTSLTISRNSAYTTLPFVFIVLGTMNYSEKDLLLFKKCILLSTFVVVMPTMINGGFTATLNGRFTLNDRNDPNNLAALLLLPIGIALESFFGKRHFLSIVSGVIALYLLLVTGSRGGLISVFVMTLYYLWRIGLL